MLDALFSRIKRISVAEDDSQALFLIVGLGNPGREYRLTRHNIGFLAVDAIAKGAGISLGKVQFKALIGQGKINGQKIILAKPQTYMNLSGQAVCGILKFYKIPKENLLVIHDDIDLPFGTIRIRPGGGSAGQKGIGSIIERLGTQDFARMRLGLGRPPGQMDPKDYVLQSFSKTDEAFLQSFLQKAGEAVSEFVSHGLDAAMNRYNGTV